MGCGGSKKKEEEPPASEADEGPAELEPAEHVAPEAPLQAALPAGGHVENPLDKGLDEYGAEVASKEYGSGSGGERRSSSSSSSSSGSSSSGSSSSHHSSKASRDIAVSRNLMPSETSAVFRQIGGGGEVDFRASLREAGDRLVMVFFYEDNCESCDAMEELYEEFVLKYPGVLFLESNISHNAEAVQQLRLKFLPTFIAFKNHLEVGRLVDTKVEAIEDLVKANMG